MAITKEDIQKRLATVAESFASTIKRAQEYGRVALAFQEAVPDIKLGDGFSSPALYGGEIKIKREELPTLRKGVGKLKVVGKSPSYDYDNDSLVHVTVQPCGGAFKDLKFQYDTIYRGGKKCKVVQDPPSKTFSLVCER